MPILESVRNMLTRRRPDEPELDQRTPGAATATIDTDLAGTQAGKLFQVLQASEQVRRATSPDPDADLQRPAKATSTIETKPARKKTPADVQLDSGEVVHLVRRIGQHLDDHASNTAQMLTLLERMPTALSTLPELNRQTSHLLEIATDAQQHARKRDESLNQSLDRIGAASERHTEVLGLLQQQLDSNNQSSQRITETLDSFRQVLSDMSSSTSQQVDVLSRMARASEKRELRITTTLAKTQKWMIAAMIFCGVVTLAALGVVVVVLVS